MGLDYSVLVVEADELIQTEINSVLKTDFNIEQVLTTRSSQDAISQLTNGSDVYCIIVDSSVDDNSFQLVKEIKKIDKFRDVSVLMISEQKSSEYLLQAAACGVTDFISKPFSNRSLGLKLKKLLGSKKLRKVERISTMGAFDITLAFNDALNYQAKLRDISLGGCSAHSELFSKGGCVYDRLFIKIGSSQFSLTLQAELVRIEKDPECEDKSEKQLLVAFQFKDLSESDKHQLGEFINFVAQSKNLNLN